MVGTVKHGGGGSVLVWGAFGSAGVGQLVFIPRTPKFTSNAYVQLLEDHLVPSIESALEKHNEDWYLLQDNDPKHKAAATIEYFIEKGIPLIDWPLHPIENLWRIMKEELVKEGFHAHSRKEIEDKLNDLVFSMPSRLRACIDAKGGPTRF